MLFGISIISFFVNYLRFRSQIVSVIVVVGMEDGKDEDGSENADR